MSLQRAGTVRTFSRARRPGTFSTDHNFLNFPLVCTQDVVESPSSLIKSVSFPKHLDRVVRRHNKYPSIVNSEHVNGRKGDPQLRHDAIVIQELEKLARVRAWELHAEVFPDDRRSYAEEYDDFFVINPSTRIKISKPPYKEERAPRRIVGQIVNTTYATPSRTYVVDSGASFHAISYKAVSYTHLTLPTILRV